MKYQPLAGMLCAVLWAGSVSAQDRGPLNEHLPNWLTVGVQNRVRAEGVHGAGFQPGSDLDFLLERSRFSLNLKPQSWLTLYGEVQDSRAFWMPRPDASVKDVLDVRQAWGQFGSESKFWDLKVGRQKLVYGSERVVGGAEWGNTARVFDAARLALHWGKDRVDVFSSSVVNNDVDHWDHHWQGNNLHGVYASFGSWLAGARVEPYLLLHDDHVAAAHTWTAGLRTAGALGRTWGYEAEAQRQTGDSRANRFSAWALTLQGQRHFPEWKWRPTLMAEGNYASGDTRPGDGVSNTLDQLYPTNHGYYGIADVVGRRNTRNVRGGLWLRPEKWLTIKTEAHSFWLASRYDGLYAASGALTVAAPVTGAVSTDVGKELDVIGEVKLSRHYDIGAQYGHLFPGEFLHVYSKGAGRDFYAVFLDWRL